jgi:hypothetical protein
MKSMAWMLIPAILLSSASCFKKNPGPISVQNEVSPGTVQSGGYVDWEVSVTNQGGKVTISRIHLEEECIAGWGVGIYGAELDVPLSNSEVAANATEVVHAQTSPCLNTGPNDITIQNTVTVYSNGGTDTDVTTYKILCSKAEGSSSIVKGLLK